MCHPRRWSGPQGGEQSGGRTGVGPSGPTVDRLRPAWPPVGALSSCTQRQVSRTSTPASRLRRRPVAPARRQSSGFCSPASGRKRRSARANRMSVTRSLSTSAEVDPLAGLAIPSPTPSPAPGPPLEAGQSWAPEQWAAGTALAFPGSVGHVQLAASWPNGAPASRFWGRRRATVRDRAPNACRRPLMRANKPAARRLTWRLRRAA